MMATVMPTRQHVLEEDRLLKCRFPMLCSRWQAGLPHVSRPKRDLDIGNLPISLATRGGGARTATRKRAQTRATDRVSSLLAGISPVTTISLCGGWIGPVANQPVVTLHNGVLLVRGYCVNSKHATYFSILNHLMTR